MKDEIKNTTQKSTSHSRLNKHVIIVCIATTFGTSIPVGYQLSVINSPAEYVKNWCNETITWNYGVSLNESRLDILWASIVSILLVGGVIGSSCGAWIADRYGRKLTLLAGSILLILGAIMFLLCRPTNSVEILAFARFLVGLACGIITATGPMYLSEIVPLSLRGSAGTLLSLGIVGGIILGEAMSLDETLGAEDLWEYGFSVYVILVVICILPYYWFPESPKYLYIILGDKERARDELMRLRDGNLQLVDEEIELMEDELKLQNEKRSIFSIITDPALILPAFLVSVMQAGHQLSGVNAVIYYSVSIFEKAGINSSNAKWINLGTGLAGFLVASTTPIINAKLNRRPVILFAVFGSAICLTVLTIVISLLDFAAWLSYASIIAIFSFIIIFETGYGPIPFFIASELFESSPRPAGMALGSIVSWTCNILVGITFPILQTKIGALVFLQYAIFTFAVGVFLKIYLPETRGVDTSIVATLVNKGFKSKPLITSRVEV